MSKKFWKAAAIRALRTVAQTLSSNLAVGIVVTPAMIKFMDIEILYIILAWLATGLISGLESILMAIATGLPEVDDKW